MTEPKRTRTTRQRANEGPVFHGDDAVASVNAQIRAQAIGGYAIKSKSPDGKGVGYWSDTSGFLRTWETQIWPR